MAQGMPLRIQQEVMDLKTPIYGTKHYIDASPEKTKDYNNPITIGDKTVFISDAGKQALIDNAKESKHDHPFDNNMKIMEDQNDAYDWFWGIEEEGVVKQPGIWEQLMGG